MYARIKIYMFPAGLVDFYWVQGPQKKCFGCIRLCFADNFLCTFVPNSGSTDNDSDTNLIE